ncbi:MAG: hypothetical protein ABSE86_17325 [Bryobacteraceae bacterium]|jgi:hypothetical protein
MHYRFCSSLLIMALSPSLPARAQGVSQQGAPNNSSPSVTKVPTGVILVKGAWSSASDSVTPVPEGGKVADGVFTDSYFGMSYALTGNWTEKYTGPPPSDTGLYVLAQLSPAATFNGPSRGSILITAQDMFFTPLPATNVTELINYMKDNLGAGYELERSPAPVRIANRSFSLFAYWSPVAQLHWVVLATQIRCHAIQIVLTSRDTQLLDGLILDMHKMKLPEEASPIEGAGGGAEPVCVKDYARDDNVIARVDPVFSEHRFNPVPVRIIIDKEGKVKHIHFLSAFADQAKVITEALGQWKFKPYLLDGRPSEIETGILFGHGSVR